MTLLRDDRQEVEYSISQMFGDVIASRFDQHIICAIIGKTGQGKSNASLDIAYKTSLYLSEVLGGDPEKYFTLDNVAIITMESVIDVIKNMKKQNVYILDDIGTGWNARDFAKKSNKLMNNIVQTFRKWRTLLMLTMPDTFLIDTVPRNLLHYQIEMQSAAFRWGITFGKISEVKRLYRMGKNIYPFPSNANTKYVNCVFERAPKHIINEYEKKRTEIQEAEQDRYTEELSSLLEGAEKEYSKITVQEMKIINTKHEHPEMSQLEIGKAVNLHGTNSSIQRKVSRVLAKANIDSNMLCSSAAPILR